MISLQPGANAPIGSLSPTACVRFRAGSGVKLDVSAYLLRSDGKVSGDHDMIFYNQPASRDGSVRLSGIDAVQPDGRTQTSFALDLAAVPAHVEKIALTAVIEDGVARRQTFASVAELETVLTAGDRVLVGVPANTSGAREVALVLAEIYRRQGAWKIRAVGQGFAGGLKALAESYGVVVDDQPARQPPPPTPPPAPPRTGPVPSVRPTTPPAPSQPPVNLSKVSLTKASPSVSLAKRAGGHGEIKINLDWNRGHQGRSGGFFGLGKPKGIDLDLGCLFEMTNGGLGAVQALGDSFGAFDRAPYIALLGDDRTGATSGGEWMRINGARWSEIRRVLIYTFIYEGAPNWAATDAVVTLHPSEGAPIEVRLDETSPLGMCAIALIENDGGAVRINREVRYFQGHRELDRAYGWGLRWQAGSKD